MTFLSNHDAIAADQPQQQIGPFIQHLKGDQHTLYDELREDRAVFNTPFFIMFTGDKTEINWLEKGFMQCSLPREDLSRVIIPEAVSQLIQKDRVRAMASDEGDITLGDSPLLEHIWVEWGEK